MLTCAYQGQFPEQLLCKCEGDEKIIEADAVSPQPLCHVQGHLHSLVDFSGTASGFPCVNLPSPAVRHFHITGNPDFLHTLSLHRLSWIPSLSSKHRLKLAFTRKPAVHRCQYLARLWWGISHASLSLRQLVAGFPPSAAGQSWTLGR